MAFRIAAPFPDTQTTIVLPNPEFGNHERLNVEINQKRAIDGTLRTYVKRKGTRTYLWSFRLTRNKAIELRDYFFSYHSSRLLIEDRDGRKWHGHILNNPHEITMARRGSPAVGTWPAGEVVETQIEFSGTPLTPDPRSPLEWTVSTSDTIESQQEITADMDAPTTGLLHQWDAAAITPQGDNTRLTSWSSPSGVNLVPFADYKSIADSGFDYAPYYQTNIFGAHPGIYFTSETGNTHQGFNAAQTDVDVSFFPNKRGTLFWIMRHNVGGLPTGFDGWRQNSDDNTLWDHGLEKFTIPGGAHNLGPATYNFTPENNNVTPKLQGNWEVIPRGQPLLYMVQRDTATNLRFRINGIEKDGRLIPDNLPASDRFRIGVGDNIMTGWWGEILNYNSAINDSQIAKIESAMAAKWGVCLGTDITALGDCYPHFCRSFPTECNGNVPKIELEGYDLDTDCNCNG